MSAAERARLLDLLRERSYERRRVVLASGRESDFFIDCKQTILTAEGHALCGSLLLELLGRLDPCEAVAGVELGGCPLASAVSLTSFLRSAPGLPALYVRKKQKDHGSRRMVEGDRSLRPDLPVALLEDVITTGGSSLAAVASLRDAGARVVGIAALVDREEGGREAIEAAGLPLISLYRRSDFTGAPPRPPSVSPLGASGRETRRRARRRPPPLGPPRPPPTCRREGRASGPRPHAPHALAALAAWAASAASAA